MGGMICKHCGQGLQERWFWAHETDTVYIQGQPTVGDAPGRTIWATSPLTHEPEPQPISEPASVTPAELADMRAVIARLSKEKGE
jgi:hypothetical protein